MVAICMKPKLTLDYQIKSLLFILSQKVPMSLKFNDQLNVMSFGFIFIARVVL